MKLFLSLIAILFLTQNVFATGASGEDPNIEMSPNASEAGTLATAAVAAGSQPKACVTCGTAGTASMVNSVGVLNQENVSSSGSPSSGPVKTGQ